METHVEAFRIQKAGSTLSEYEDAFYPACLTDTPQDCDRVAIADGATDSSFSGIWANLLVKAFVDRCLDVEDFLALLSDVQPQWKELVGQRELPWYAAEKVQAGAFSSLLGFTILGRSNAERQRRWRALAVGDSCLVQVRDEQTTVRFPLEHSSLFNSSPFLVPSNPQLNAEVSGHIAVKDGDAQAGDCFYLMTDALACWFMSEDEQGRRPWELLRDLNTRDQAESFEEFIARLRACHAIKNDDCTLIRVDIL